MFLNDTAIITSRSNLGLLQLNACEGTRSVLDQMYNFNWEHGHVFMWYIALLYYYNYSNQFIHYYSYFIHYYSNQFIEITPQYNWIAKQSLSIDAKLAPYLQRLWKSI